MSIVSKEDYWITILNDYSQFGQINTEDNEFNSIANDVWNVLENSFIKIDDEESIIKWEEMTGLSGEGLTIFQRKVNILYTLTVKNYLPIGLFTQAMDRLVGEDNYFITFNEETQKYEVRCDEDYEASASFLNKRLANESVELEISPLPAGYLAAEFLEITGCVRSAEVTYPYPHFSIPLPAVTDTDVWEFNTVHAVNFSTGINQAEGSNSGSKSLFYGATTAGKFYAGSGKNVITTSTYTVDNKPHAFSFQQKGTLSYASFDGQEIKLNDNSTTYPSSIGVFVALKDAVTSFYHYPFNGKKYSWRLSINGTNVHNLIPALDSAGVPCMYDRVIKQPFYNAGTGSFIVGLTTSQARQLSKLPVTETGTLTLSLPWETQLVITGVPAALQAAADKGWTITVQYRDPEVYNAYFIKYAQCKTRADMLAVNPDFANDLTSDGKWIYPLPKLEDSQTGHPNNFWNGSSASFPALKEFCVPLPKLKNGRSLFYNCPNLVGPQVYEFPELVDSFIMFGLCHSMTSIKLIIPKVTHAHQPFWMSKNLRHIVIVGDNITKLTSTFGEINTLEIVECDTSKVQTAQTAFCYATNLKEFPLEYPSLSNAPRMFEGSNITGQQAITILNSIPSYASGEHLITMGIHIDYQNDTDVLTAITDAEDKGWTLTVQWNGTATAAAAAVSTFGLRSPSIYAKLGTMEYPDGTIKPSLDWGHYVTNWEENGYQEFSSIEEANEYFNIESETEQ